MTVFLEGVAAQFYRGIGAETQYIAPFGTMNFFIGANNAGKSIVLNLIADHVGSWVHGKVWGRLKEFETYKWPESGNFKFAVCTSTSKALALILGPNPFAGHENIIERYQRIQYEMGKLDNEITHEGFYWVGPVDGSDPRFVPKIDTLRAKVLNHNLPFLYNELDDGLGRSMVENLAFKLELAFRHSAVPFHLVPAKRMLGETGETFEDLTGKGLLQHLAKIQNPNFDREQDRLKFSKINSFLQEVTGKPDARLEVPYERNHLLVHMDNKVLPLSALGTGIHEVILIAAFSTIHDGSIMCIEEPEIHLHPVLQRKLIAYLAANTTSQYFIATHSAAFMDTPGAHIFHVTNDGVQTRVTAALTKNSQRSVLDDLGYHASDILQANSVIWVEGPSDRIYLNHWIKHVDDRLIEGIHYSIMFYGGALISHLSASDDEVDEFIALRKLNRNTAILMDSDRSSAEAALKPNVDRIVEEMAKDGGIAWVTDGREVENYVDGDKLQAALQEVHPQLYKGPCTTGDFDHAFYFYRDNPAKPGQREKFKDGDKVKVARVICKSPPNLERLHLRDRLADLCLMICKANGIEPKGIN